MGFDATFQQLLGTTPPGRLGASVTVTVGAPFALSLAITF
jgi:hypothetical protein